eukprot:TRINITY_DN95668_c0_g1_i1.p2 TRINITY_DN95668_c0_g1~~TRINITY_DN95668_c0_g1_i1.p2  ORF type:complete len:124 (-),score=38.40 TRINITY_DN95668_c0_g1_i1:9-380(-)
MSADVSSMSIKELKATIERAGMSHSDCMYKEELRTRAAEALQKATEAATDATSKDSQEAFDADAVAAKIREAAAEHGVNENTTTGARRCRCPLCGIEIVAGCEEDCVKHMAECNAFSAQAGMG